MKKNKFIKEIEVLEEGIKDEGLKLKIYESDNFILECPCTLVGANFEHLESFNKLLISVFIDDEYKYKESKKTRIGPFHLYSQTKENLFLHNSFLGYFIFKNKYGISDFSIRQQVLEIIKTLDILRNIQKINEIGYSKFYSKKS